jgi:hypothetical protein
MDTDLLIALYDLLAAIGVPDTDPKLRIRRKELDDGTSLVEVSYDREVLVYEVADTEDEALLAALQEVTGAFEGVLDDEGNA